MKVGHQPLSAEVESLATSIVDAAFSIHSSLGPGLLESVYESCMAFELASRGIEFQSQVNLPITYKDLQIDAGLRLDLLVGRQVIVELKAVEAILPVHEAQLLTYLKLTKNRLGLLINFNVPLIKNGVKRIVL